MGAQKKGGLPGGRVVQGEEAAITEALSQEYLSELGEGQGPLRTPEKRGTVQQVRTLVLL